MTQETGECSDNPSRLLPYNNNYSNDIIININDIIIHIAKKM